MVRSGTGNFMRFSAVSAIAALALTMTFPPYSNLAAFLLRRQDLWLLLVGAIIMAMACFRAPERQHLPVVRWRYWAVVSLLLAIVTFAGHFLILSAYDLCRDEQMASFDAAVFGQGHLVSHIPALWRDHSDALNTRFMYPAVHREAWISSYLPLNAGLRALIAMFGSPYLAGPLMTALGAIALSGCVRQIWPEDREAGFIALVLYAGSAQILFTGMTSYAMPAHLALNLCWLWLFLKRGWATDCAALAVGFVAMGLHQLLMHPMFAAPFVLLLLAERRWHRATIYVIGYTAITAFWVWWPHWMSVLVQVNVAAPQTEASGYVARLIGALRDRDTLGTPDMIANFLRFIAWQHLLLVPLMLTGLRQYRKNPLIIALGGGMIVTTLFMAVVLPSQGFGFGYRYFHGLIGNGILLAIFGWRSLGSKQGQWRTVLQRSTIAGIMVMMPLQALMAHRLYKTSAQVSAGIDRINTDYVVFGPEDVPTATDLLFNPPSLDRRPIRLMRDKLDDATIAAVCSSHPSIALVGNATLAPVAAYYGFGVPLADAFNPLVAYRLTRAGCYVRRVD